MRLDLSSSPAHRQYRLLRKVLARLFAAEMLSCRGSVRLVLVVLNRHLLRPSVNLQVTNLARKN